MQDYHKAAQQLLQDHDYYVYGKLTQAGCSFYYPPRLLEPRSNGFRRDYQLTPEGISIQAWHGEELRDGFDIECPPYARKSCIICDTIFCCSYLQYNATLLKYFIDDTEVDEGTLLRGIDGGDEETPEMLEKEKALKALIQQAYQNGFSDGLLQAADQYGVLVGYNIVCRVCQGDMS